MADLCGRDLGAAGPCALEADHDGHCSDRMWVEMQHAARRLDEAAVELAHHALPLITTAGERLRNARDTVAMAVTADPERRAVDPGARAGYLRYADEWIEETMELLGKARAEIAALEDE